jgi:outer membrane murein-binding lipoprotein Lpp
VRLSPRPLIFAIIVLVPLVAGCSSAPRKRPVKGGDVNTGPGSLEAVRRQLEGQWDLVAVEVLDAAGKAAQRKATGHLSYDAYGNLGITGKLLDTDQPQTSVSGILAYTGRAVIDPGKSRLVLMDVQSKLPSSEAIPAEVSPDKVRYYVIEGNTLTLTVKDAAGATTGRTTWRKIQ